MPSLPTESSHSLAATAFFRWKVKDLRDGSEFSRTDWHVGGFQHAPQDGYLSSNPHVEGGLFPFNFAFLVTPNCKRQLRPYRPVVEGEQLTDGRRVAETEQRVRHGHVLVDAGEPVAEGEQAEVLETTAAVGEDGVRLELSMMTGLTGTRHGQRGDS